jgi:hypothetical protein
VDSAASGNQRPRLALMKSLAWRMLQASPKTYLQLVVVAAISFPFFLDVEIFARHFVDWIQQGFLAVTVDSETFIRGCF